MILIYGSKLGSKIARMSALISFLLVCMVSAAPVFAEDVPAGACQASNSLSVLVRGKSVVAYVPKGASPSTVGIPVTISLPSAFTLAP